MWDQFILNPMINALLLFYQFLGNNFVLALTVFTVLIRVILIPLGLRQQRSSMRMQELQPQIKEIQNKYKDNPQKMQEEFQKIGYNPAETLTGCLPMLIQLPILFGLYRAIFFVLGSTPQALFELTQRAYSFIDLSQLLPVENKFLWLNLAQPDPWFVLPVLVFATMFLQQRLMSPASQQQKKNKKNQQDDPTASMTQSMQYTMPIMFGFISLQFQAGLSIYFVLANIIGIGQSWYMRRAMAAAKAEEAGAAGSSNGAEAKTQKKAKATSDSKDGSTYQRKRRSRSKRKRRSAKR